MTLSEITAHEVKQLSGGRFELVDRSSGDLITFKILPPSSNGSIIRPGGEAYGVCADGDGPGGSLPAFLKIFRVDIPERRQRNLFLAGTRLARCHWMFRGVPFGFLSREINGIQVHANLSHRIRNRSGEIAAPVGDLLEEGEWTTSSDQRIRFCGQLCCAVYALEELGLVHGDISLGNVLIGWDDEQGDVATLIDFDGFYHPKLPLLPLKVGRSEVRRAGSPGFFSPLVLEEAERSPESVCVRSDRMALAALVFQLMIWEDWMYEELNQVELLPEELIRSRDPSLLPEQITSTWREGWELLCEALAASHHRGMPGPRAWLALLGGPQPPEPYLIIRNRQLFFRKKVVLSNLSGSFESVHPALRDVVFDRSLDKVKLFFSWNEPVLRSTSEGGGMAQGTQVILRPGASVSSNSWTFDYLQKSP